jgi:hypothetical protein
MGVSMQSLSYACVGDALQTMEHQGAMFLGYPEFLVDKMPKM